MKNQNFLSQIFFLIVFYGNIIAQTSSDQPLYREGKLYLQLKSNSNVAINNATTIVNDPGGSFQALFTKYQVVRTELPYAILNTSELNKTYRITFSQITRVDSFIIDLSQISSHVAYAEKVPAVYTFSVPNDPMATSPSAVLYHLPLLNANQASNIHIASGNAVVAIVDDAVLTSHEDLAANIGSVNTGSDVANADSDPNPPFTGPFPAGNGVFTHGTHVAGIAGAVTNNSIGIASIGWNNKLMCVKTCSDNSSSQALTNPWDGLAWAATNGAHVINMSWGAYVFSQTDYNVVVAAKSYDVVLVAAAGNAASNLPLYPAAYGEGTTGQTWEVFDKKLVIAVAALDQNNDISVWGAGSGSNYGTWVDIAAYGTNIMSTLAASSSGSAVINQYGLLSGTSMAAPMVSGIAGVMRSYNMSKTADEIIDCLINTADPDIYGSGHPTNQLGSLGLGRADAEAALRCISNSCSVNPIVIIVPSSPNLCASTTLTLTTNQGASSYSWSTGATTSSIIINTPGIYSVEATYPAHCTATASINFAAPPTLSLSLTTNTSICTGFSLNLVSAGGNYSTLVWQPGGMTTNSVVVNPTVYTVYTVTANQMCGGTTATIGVNPTGSSQPPYAGYSVLGSTLVGNYVGSPIFALPSVHYIINTNATVNTIATFYWSDVLMAPNIKITVPSGGTLNINEAHLQTCGTDMWQGIVVNDGAKISCDNQSVIEDAVTAISSTHTPLSSPGLPPAEMSIQYTVFNRNYISISLTDCYDLLSGPLSYSNALKVRGCVFTCRSFSTPWPSAGTGPGANGIRVANTPTTALTSPYLSQWSTTTLKSPYNSQPSHIAINLKSVGITTGSPAATNGTASMPGITIGDEANVDNYNVFDTHGSFIVADHSNITLKNNVFQNTKTYSVSSGSNYSGSAIKHIELGTMHTMLNMSGSVPSTGNRFWDCHKSIDIKNTYLFWLENAIIRSTQSSSSAATSYSPGNMGIFATTNRFDYYIANNEFTNLRTGINIPVTPATLAIAPCSICANYGVFANAIRIAYNTFAAASPTSAYMNQGIYITGMQGNPYYIPTTSVSPFVQAFSITGNTLTNVTNGGWVNSSRGFQVDISNNDIFLRETGSVQHGFKLTNSSPTTSTSVGKNIISGNSASLSAALSGTGSSLVFCGHNGVGVQSPSVTCNSLAESYEGFVFEGYNQNATWMGNDMTTPINRALALYTAAIGVQGGTTYASNNRWVGGSGSWTSNYSGTYVGNGSNALNSFLYVASGSAPPNNLSFVPLADYGNVNAYATTSGGGDYTCGDFPNAKIIVPEPGHFSTELSYYMAMDDFYRFNLTNDSVRNSDVNVDNYVIGLSGSSVDYFYQIDEKISQHDAAVASSILLGMDDDSFNTVETNYKTYFLCHLSYLDLGPEDAYPYSDSIALRDLATLCPGDNGSPVYRAISLFNSIYGEVLSPDCSESSRRMVNEGLAKNSINGISQIKLFPNPAKDQLTIETKSVNQELTIEIRDLSNRVVLIRSLKTNGFFANLDLNLINGVYLISVKDSTGERAIKKLVISK